MPMSLPDDRSVAFSKIPRRQQPAQRIEPLRVGVAVGDPLVEGAVRFVVAARARALGGARLEVGEGADDPRRVDVMEPEGADAGCVDHPAPLVLVP